MMRDRNDINLFIVHHSLSHWGTGAIIRGWHTDPVPRGMGWRNPGYHAVICGPYPDYYAWRMRQPVADVNGRCDRILSEPEWANGAADEIDARALHVCIVGDFDKYMPTAAQMDRLTGLLSYWCKTYDHDPRVSVYGHGEAHRKLLGHNTVKTCPGVLVDMDEIRGMVYEMRKG